MDQKKEPPLLHHVIFGTGQRPLLLLCGFQAELNCWRSVQSILAKQSTSIAIENRGFGRTELDDIPLTIERMADDVLRLAQSLKLDSFFLAGHSMGGAIAQVIAHRVPHLVEGLALCNTFRVISDESRAFLGSMLNALESGQDPVAVRQQMLMRTFSASALRITSSQTIAQQQVRRKIATTESFRQQFEAICAFDSRRWIARIAVPTLVIYSEGDLVAGAVEAKAITDAIRGSKIIKLPGSHASMIEHPGLLADALSVLFSVTPGKNEGALDPSPLFVPKQR